MPSERSGNVGYTARPVPASCGGVAASYTPRRRPSSRGNRTEHIALQTCCRPGTDVQATFIRHSAVDRHYSQEMHKVTQHYRHLNCIYMICLHGEVHLFEPKFYWYHMHVQ